MSFLNNIVDNGIDDKIKQHISIAIFKQSNLFPNYFHTMSYI